MASKPTNAGIITDASGVRRIPESTRADGSTRRAIKIRPGYQPPEDVALYKNRTAESFRNRLTAAGVPGAEAAPAREDAARAPAASVPGAVPGAVPGSSAPSAGAAASAAGASANKNAKRREARKKAAAAAGAGDVSTPTPTTTTLTAAPAVPAVAPAAPAEDPSVEREKKARGLRKKLKQAKELKSKHDGGETLLPEQIAKVIRMNVLIQELEALGFDAEGEPKAGDAETKTT